MRGEAGSAQSKIGTLTAELEETKQSLQKAREEANFMASCIQSLKEEMEQTKKELREAKARELMLLQHREEPEMEDLKFIENATKVEMIKTEISSEEAEEKEYFQKKRYVKFASPHALAHVINGAKEEVIERGASIKKAKRKPIVPLIGWLFAKKKGEVDSPRACL